MTFSPGKRLRWSAVALIAIGALFFRNHERLVRTFPLLPAAGSVSPALSSEIARAHRAARSYLHRSAGLADLSRLYHANGFFVEAEACYRALRQLQPKEARWYHLHAGILAGFGDLDAAEPLQRQAVALAPEYLPAALRLGDIQLKNNRSTLAAATYAEIVKRDPSNRYGFLGIAKCAAASGDSEAARVHLKRALSIAPEFPAALAMLITVEERRGDGNEARALAVKLGKREAADFPDPWLDDLAADCFDPYRLSVIAAASVLADNSSAAIRWLTRAIDLAPKEGTYRRQLGKLFFQAGDLASAREHVSQAVTLTPTDSDAWILLAEIATAMSDPAAADRALVQGAQVNPQSPGLHYAMGRRLAAAGRFPEAMRELKTAQALRPNEVNAGIDLAMIYFQAERIEEGVAELKAVLAIQPGHPLALQILARHAVHSNDEVAARRWWRELQQQPRAAAEDLQVIAQEFRQQFGKNPN